MTCIILKKLGNQKRPFPLREKDAFGIFITGQACKAEGHFVILSNSQPWTNGIAVDVNKAC